MIGIPTGNVPALEQKKTRTEHYRQLGNYSETVEVAKHRIYTDFSQRLKASQCIFGIYTNEIGFEKFFRKTSIFHLRVFE